jgi:A/G-specific adenine glycosylase
MAEMASPPFARLIIDWQRQHGRHDLPWQQTHAPYRIWLSEIMLQQTQVTTVLPYYLRFLDRFPTLATLAAAPVEDVLEHWAGLGYYARARNLHRCAQTVMQAGGEFPQDVAALAALPGIGRSTAAAIAAFSFGVRATILDGNVKRVLCRAFAIEGFPNSSAVDKQLWALAESLLPEQPSHDEMIAYIQGLMDLGATQCLRRKPRCLDCPLLVQCLARQQGRQAELPTPKPGKPLPERESLFVVLTRSTANGPEVLLQRRPPSGIWGGLLVPPEIPLTTSSQPEAALLAQLATATAQDHGLTLSSTPALLAPLRHTFTHFRLTLHPLSCPVSLAGQLPAEASWLPAQAIDTAALPTPIRKLLLGLKT